MLKQLSTLAALLMALTWPSAGRAQTVEYIHTDALGSPVAITDAAGKVTERTVYEPYGATVNKAVVDGPGYTGHVTDATTGLSYMQQRYYDSGLGMFLSLDPISAVEGGVLGFNRFRYAAGNPYRFYDPDGRACAAKTGTNICMGEARLRANLKDLNKRAVEVAYVSPTAAAKDFAKNAIPLQEASGKEIYANMEERHSEDFRLLDYSSGGSRTDATIHQYTGSYRWRAMLHTHPENNTFSGAGVSAQNGKFWGVGPTDSSDIAAAWQHGVDSYIATPDGTVQYFNLKRFEKDGRNSGASKIYAGWPPYTQDLGR
ncbi:RHS repeat-associated core domain-containing protein [Xanthomonas axonopodis pv. ricini]|uniref:RHS repeat-associated core domain-containing protein n=1 Tax=Xanthomonas euvesicatoria TaxID=456327 RepID=UPI0024566C8D|nr:RHS repeat-associated core domain-containing protein [Xanthomonas euvesicatoria]MDH4909908.1 RHS domain-containing protein [Xanthomonas euvesicatoria]